MSLFDEYYSEYTTLVKQTSDLTAELLASNPFDAGADERVQRSSEAVEKVLGMAGDVVKQMEIHGRGLKKPANRCFVEGDALCGCCRKCGPAGN